MPRPTYFFAILTTKRKFAWTNFLFAIAPGVPPWIIALASSISSFADNNLIRPISLKYKRTGSSTATPFGTSKSSAFSSWESIKYTSS